ncbi:hypothetical protein SAMN05428975_6031 [Mucilaginibacter sp. OK268]|nr:hypothetical protein SAMN05428975_6031 [Mucilaginibacter sp. OK268]
MVNIVLFMVYKLSFPNVLSDSFVEEKQMK